MKTVDKFDQAREIKVNQNCLYLLCEESVLRLLRLLDLRKFSVCGALLLFCLPVIGRTRAATESVEAALRNGNGLSRKLLQMKELLMNGFFIVTCFDKMSHIFYIGQYVENIENAEIAPIWRKGCSQEIAPSLSASIYPECCINMDKLWSNKIYM